MESSTLEHALGSLLYRGLTMCTMRLFGRVLITILSIVGPNVEHEGQFDSTAVSNLSSLLSTKDWMDAEPNTDKCSVEPENISLTWPHLQHCPFFLKKKRCSFGHYKQHLSQNVIVSLKNILSFWMTKPNKFLTKSTSKTSNKDEMNSCESCCSPLKY